MKYKRILLKLSGEALMGDRQYGIDPVRLAEYAEEIKKFMTKDRNSHCDRWWKYF
jgi:uridylate kinase